jgi:hypothetical protein
VGRRALWTAGHALLLGVVFGGSLHTADAGTALIKQFLSILLAVAVINL